MASSSAACLAAPLAWHAVGCGVTLRSSAARLGFAALASARMVVAQLVARLVARLAARLVARLVSGLVFTS